MKTEVKYLKIKPMDEKNFVTVRIATKNGDLMNNRVIQILSQYPRKRVKYDILLEIEICHDMTRSVVELIKKLVATTNEDINAESFGAELCEALHIENGEPCNSLVYMIICETADTIMGVKKSDRTQEASHRLVQKFDEYGSDNLVVQMLKVRRKIKNFIRRYETSLKNSPK